MKKIFSFLFIIAISTSVNANNNKNFPRQIGVEPKIIVFQNLNRIFKEKTLVALVKNEANNLELWNLLDTNNDEFISKTEAVYSPEIMKRWDELDSNKDGKLDFFDFSRLSNRES